MDEFNCKPEECDVVMEGGITSGVVYPTFVAGLAKHFRLRSIGGASVGAVAAIAAAAAQYRRNLAPVTTGAPDGFDTLGNLPGWLGEADHEGRTNLFRLFQPTSALRPHHEVLITALDGEGFWHTAAEVGGALISKFQLGAVAGAILVVLLRGVWPTGPVAWLLFGLWALAGVLAGAAFHFAWSGYRALCAHRFGICSGMSAHPEHGPALTEWLYGYTQDLAGLPPTTPLTFRLLAASPHPIELVLMTTGITEVRAHQLPYELRDLVFRKSEMALLFPAAVVDWLTAHPPVPNTDPKRRGRTDGLLKERDPAFGTPQQDWHRMPEGPDLPVIIAARLSLSFPLLMQAIPLYRLRWVGDAHDGKYDLVRVWYSDGGLTNNFPIHLFDAPLPDRPTFGVTLEGSLKEESGVRFHLPDNAAKPVQHAYQPSEDSHGRPSLIKAGLNLLQTIRTWRYDALKRVPGYRDRIVLIRHTAKEGGLNLNMSSTAIALMAASGTAAAQLIATNFLHNDPLKNAWVAHRWVRLRSCAGLFDQKLAHVADAFKGDYAAMWRAGDTARVQHYKLDLGQVAPGLAFFSGIDTAVKAASADLAKGTPNPQPVLIIAPKPD